MNLSGVCKARIRHIKNWFSRKESCRASAEAIRSLHHAQLSIKRQFVKGLDEEVFFQGDEIIVFSRFILTGPEKPLRAWRSLS